MPLNFTLIFPRNSVVKWKGAEFPTLTNDVATETRWADPYMIANLKWVVVKIRIRHHIEWFSFECRKTKVITLANHKEHRQYSEPIKIRSNYM